MFYIFIDFYKGIEIVKIFLFILNQFVLFFQTITLSKIL